MESAEPNNTMYLASSDKEPSSKSSKRKGLILALIVIVTALAIAAIVYFLVTRNDDVDATKPVHTVTIGDSGFTPATIKIKKGEELAWVNQDINAHEITADQEDAPGLDSTTPLAEGDSYIFSFEKEGTIQYYDPLNPTVFKGTVIVE